MVAFKSIRKSAFWQAFVTLLLLHLASASSRRLQYTLDSLASISGYSSSPVPNAYRWPRDPVFDDPWVKQNIAVAYGHKVQDGIGSQTLRMVALYALSRSLGIGHVFKPLGCVGHIGTHVHYRNTGCNFTNEAETRQLNKARHMINLPTTVPDSDLVFWDNKFVPSLDWSPWVKEVQDALINKRPTLFLVERVNNLIRYYPDVFLSIPALRPKQPPAPLACRNINRGNNSSAVSHSKSWLLDALRIAVHIRRGDVITDNWHKRILDANYFINLAKAITGAVEPLGCDYAVEVYIEAPRGPEGVAEIKILKQYIPNVVMLVDTDMLWSWQMMATADIIVMSNSMFSLSAALMNPDAVAIHVPYNHYVNRVGMFKMSHWFAPMNENGTLPQAAIDEIRRRAGLSVSVTQSTHMI